MYFCSSRPSSFPCDFQALRKASDAEDKLFRIMDEYQDKLLEAYRELDATKTLLARAMEAATIPAAHCSPVTPPIEANSKVRMPA